MTPTYQLPMTPFHLYQTHTKPNDGKCILDQHAARKKTKTFLKTCFFSLQWSFSSDYEIATWIHIYSSEVVTRRIKSRRVQQTVSKGKYQQYSVIFKLLFFFFLPRSAHKAFRRWEFYGNNNNMNNTSRHVFALKCQLITWKHLNWICGGVMRLENF